jgi:hypothetical protein
VPRLTGKAAESGSILTNDTMAAILERTASPEGAIVFTTFMLPKPGTDGPGAQPCVRLRWYQYQQQPSRVCSAISTHLNFFFPLLLVVPAAEKGMLDFLSNLCYHLQKQGHLRHTLLLTTDKT